MLKSATRSRAAELRQGTPNDEGRRSVLTLPALRLRGPQLRSSSRNPNPDVGAGHENSQGPSQNQRHSIDLGVVDGQIPQNAGSQRPGGRRGGMAMLAGRE